MKFLVGGMVGAILGLAYMMAVARAEAEGC